MLISKWDIGFLRHWPTRAKHVPPNRRGISQYGRTPREWAVDRLHIRHDQESGIINNPNAWFADHPAGLVSHLRRLVQVSVETARIVAGLPPALAD